MVGIEDALLRFLLVSSQWLALFLLGQLFEGELAMAVKVFLAFLLLIESKVSFSCFSSSLFHMVF